MTIARGSLAETETFLMLAVKVGLLKDDEVKASLSLCNEISRMLTALLARLRDTLTSL